MSVEDSKGAGRTIRKLRAPSKLPIRLFGSPNPRHKRHIRNNFISSTPLNALKKNLIEVDQLSPIRNPSSTTTESSPAKLNRIDDEELQRNKITKTDEKTLATVSTTSVASFYPFPLSRLQIKNMVLCESDDYSCQSKKSIEKDKFGKLSGVNNINSAESTEKNEVNDVKTIEKELKEIQIPDEYDYSGIFLTESDKKLLNNKNKLEKDLINNKRKHSTPNKNTKENKIENDNVFNLEIKNDEIVVHETIISHKNKRGRPKKIISVNNTIEKQVEQFSQTAEAQNSVKRRGRPPKLTTTININDGTLSTKDSNKTVQFSQNNITKTQNSKLNRRGRPSNVKTSNKLSDGTINNTEESSKRNNSAIKNIPFKVVNQSNSRNNTKISTKSIESDNSLRKSSRKRISCVKYWITNNQKKLTNQKEKEISKLENKRSKKPVKDIFLVPPPPKKNSTRKPTKLIEKSLEKSSTNKLHEKEESIVVTRKSIYGKNSKILEKTISPDNDVISKTMNEISVPDKKLNTSSKTEIPLTNPKTPEKLLPKKKSRRKSSRLIEKPHEKSSTNKLHEKKESIVVTRKSKYGKNSKILEKTISPDNDVISKTKNEIPVPDKKINTSSKTEIPLTNPKTPEKLQTDDIAERNKSIQQPKTPEQYNVIDKLITLSTKKSPVKRIANKSRVLTAGKIRRSIAFKNRSSIKITTSTEDDGYTTEEENGIPTDTLLINKEDSQQNETRKRKKSSVDTFDTKKIKISNTKYSFKKLALEADISPFRAGGLADVQIKGSRCLLGCFGKFPRQFNTNANNPDISVGISLNNTYIATGMIEINPDGKKKYEYAKKADLLLVVLEGMAEVGIGNSSQVLRMGQDFFVPRDTPYYVINLSTTDKLLLYFSKYMNK